MTEPQDPLEPKSFESVAKERDQEFLNMQEDDIVSMNLEDSLKYSTIYLLEVSRKIMTRDFSDRDEYFGSVLSFPNNLIETVRRFEEIRFSVYEFSGDKKESLQRLSKIQHSFININSAQYELLSELLQDSINRFTKLFQDKIRKPSGYEEIISKYSLLASHLKSFDGQKLD